MIMVCYQLLNLQLSSSSLPFTAAAAFIIHTITHSILHLVFRIRPKIDRSRVEIDRIRAEIDIRPSREKNQHPDPLVEKGRIRIIP